MTERDQSETRLAIDEFQKLLATYPDCEQAAEARAQLQKAYDRLACAELKVAEYYKKIGKPEAAEHRLADLLRDFNAFADRCAAFAMQVEVLSKLERRDAARESLTRMESECEHSPLLAEARKRLPGAPVASEGMGSSP